jgi:hypothetical protein
MVNMSYYISLTLDSEMGGIGIINHWGAIFSYICRINEWNSVYLFVFITYQPSVVFRVGKSKSESWCGLKILWFDLSTGNEPMQYRAYGGHAIYYTNHAIKSSLTKLKESLDKAISSRSRGDIIEKMITGC